MKTIHFLQAHQGIIEDKFHGDFLEEGLPGMGPGCFPKYLFDPGKIALCAPPISLSIFVSPSVIPELVSFPDMGRPGG